MPTLIDAINDYGRAMRNLGDFDWDRNDSDYKRQCSNWAKLARDVMRHAKKIEAIVGCQPFVPREKL